MNPALNPSISTSSAAGGLSLWAQIAAQHFYLPDNVSTAQINARGQPWFILHNGLDMQQVRVDAATYQVLVKLDRQHSLSEVLATTSINEAQQEELARALLQLHSMGMLSSTAPLNIQAIIVQRQRRRRQQSAANWLRLLSPRIPLWQPDRFLSRSVHVLGHLGHPVWMFAWGLLVISAVLYALVNWQSLILYGAQHLDQTSNWVVMLLIYPLVKALHELGHGYAAKAFGAPVGHMGITFMVFLPIPYVDASETSLLTSKRQRMLIAGAGILVELSIAALALFYWAFADDGPLRDAAFATLLISGISTLLFNGNPLLRFDGYYVFSDAIEIPNLASRATRYYAYLSKRYLLGLDARSPAMAKGEAPWFALYGLASTLYRLAIGIGIAVFLFNTVPVLGILMAAWLAAIQVLLPLLRWLGFLLTNETLRGRRLSANLRAGGLVMALIACIALIPLPQRSYVDGVVQLPDSGVVRAKSEGSLLQQHVHDGQQVTQGTLLFTLQNPELQAQTTELEALNRELRTQRDTISMHNPLQREIHTERLQAAAADLQETQQRLQALKVYSPAAGQIRIPIHRDAIGRWINKGDLLAYLVPTDEARVQIVAEQAEAERIRERVERIQVRPTTPFSSPLEARLLREVPGGTDRLTDAALGSRGGGQIVVDSRDEHGLKTLQNVYAFELAIPQRHATGFIGSRVHVLIQHPPRPLLAGLYDSVRRFVLAELQH